MATVHKGIADEVIAGNGLYPGDDIRVVRIVRYNNQFDGAHAYGLIYQGEDLNRYHDSPACLNPETIWEYDPDHSEKV